jgi:L-erythro-3,5-diaminohexanoate dehydrogenase
MVLGNKYGAHRVIEPKGLLPQAAWKISNDMEILDNEILIDVDALNIDSASFQQLKASNNNDVEKIKAKIVEIVNERGKMQNPVTGSGGMLMGRIAKVGSALIDTSNVNIGDRIATLVSLSLTPLKIHKILEIKMEMEKVLIQGQAILFESGIYAKLPSDMTDAVALAALDVAGAPAQTAKLVKPGDIVLILGAAGKSGILCSYEARKRVGPTGQVLGLVRNQDRARDLMDIGFCHSAVVADARNPIDVYEATLKITHGKEVDICINCVNIPDTEMASILPVREDGIVYFFSMATSFTKAALGAEGIGKDVTMIIGNGYCKDHAIITLEELRESPRLQKIFKDKYV